jgi:cytochrome b pre-mRNA-processing protein 3
VSLLQRLFGKSADDRAALRPLWAQVVAVARQPRWYAQHGVSDTVPGRFDAVTMVLVLVLLRMERSPALLPAAARLTEIFVEDMDGQMRESGVGDLVVGKKMGRLMSVLGGRLGALRETLPLGEAAVAAAISRNVTLVEGSDPLGAARAAMALAEMLDRTADADLLAGKFGQ